MGKLRSRFASRSRRLRRSGRRTVRSDRGATATEYALLLGTVVVIVAVGVGAFGTALSNLIGAFVTDLSGWLG